MDEQLKQLQGAWAVAALEVNGAAVPAASIQGASVTVAGDRFETTSMGAVYSGRIEVNAAAMPMTISMYFEEGPEAGNVNHGIFEFHGEWWLLCLNMTGGPAPGEFKTRAGDGLALETLVRGGAAVVETAEEEIVPGIAVGELQGQWAMVSCVRSGEALPAAFAKNGRRNISGIQSTLHFGPQLFMQGNLSRDEGGTNFLRMRHTDGEAKGTTQLGIYERSGEKLKTCFGAPGRERPEQYASTAEGGETFAVWKRIK